MTPKGQSRLGSAAEVVANNAAGMAFALAAQAVILPLFDIHITAAEHVQIGALFAVVGLVRSYLMRRLFNRFTLRTAP